jgi:hypothetical protein
LEDILPRKALRKAVDLLVGNLVHESLGGQEAQLTVLDTRQVSGPSQGFIQLPSQSKQQQAELLIQLIADRLPAQP